MAVTVDVPTGIRPFTVNFPEEDLDDLRARLAATRFAERETVPDQSQGVPLTTLKKLVDRWLTNTGVSAARLYWENKLTFFATKNVTVPVGVTALPDELYPCPRSWAERAYPNLVHYSAGERGGHFAAWEQPRQIIDDVRATFRTLR